MQLLSDGAFKLYVFLCLRADRTSARLEIDQASVAKSLAKSRRSVIVYFEELKQRGVCEVNSQPTSTLAAWCKSAMRSGPM
jgi:hypothetical protein